MFESILFRKKMVEAGAKLRRLMDLSLEQGAIAKDKRIHDRYERALPVLITPWRGNQTSNADSHMGISRDMSDHGVRLFFLKEPTGQEFLLSFFLQRERNVLECFHFKATVRNYMKFAPDIYSVGMNILEHLQDGEVEPGVQTLLHLIAQDSEGLG
jgi:hypothetical protein